MQEKEVIFPKDKQNSLQLLYVTTIEIFTPDEFHIHKNLLSYHLYVHINILSLSHRIDYLKTLITNCQVKPKLIGISKCRLNKNLDVLSNINIAIEYKSEYKATKSSKGENLIYIDNSIRCKVRDGLRFYKTN